MAGEPYVFPGHVLCKVSWEPPQGYIPTSYQIVFEEHWIWTSAPSGLTIALDPAAAIMIYTNYSNPMNIENPYFAQRNFVYIQFRSGANVHIEIWAKDIFGTRSRVCSKDYLVPNSNPSP